MGSLNSNYDMGEFKPLDPEDFREKAHKVSGGSRHFRQRGPVSAFWLGKSAGSSDPAGPLLDPPMHKVVDFLADYYKNIEKYPVLSQVEPGFLITKMPETAPYCPEPFEKILGDVERDIIPGMTHWLSPNFFAFFPATVSSAAFAGEMLATCFNSVGFNWLASPAATELEMVVMDWLGNMLKLPKSFMFTGGTGGGGVIQATTSESVLCTLIAARDRALETLGIDRISKLTVYNSDQTHSTFKKACKIAGILHTNIRCVTTAAEDNFAMSPLLLRKILDADVAAGLVPIYLCATVGTTSTTAVDPLTELGDMANQYSIWLHVDAAYGGSACICPEFRHYLDGIEKADSLSLSPHKWLLSYLECCCLWVKNPSLMAKSLSTNPEYLRNKLSESNSVVDYKDWQVGTGRKFKALRLWFMLRSCGIVNLQSHIRSDVRMAKMFEGFVKSDTRFEIVVPQLFSMVCFRFNPYIRSGEGYIEILNRKLLDWVNSTGQVYMTHTIVGGIYMLRFAVGATLTEERHVVAAWKLIRGCAEGLIKGIRPTA